MKTIGITAGIKNNEVIVDRSVVDTVVKLGFLPLVFAPVSLKTMPVPSVNFDALILFIMKSHFLSLEKLIHIETNLS